ncbi:MAG: cell wall hydrolase [Ruminococcus sp.]|nr:cell wall hydrolase [Ruminococcus sp.]
MTQHKKIMAMFTAVTTGLVMTIGFSSEAADRVSAAQVLYMENYRDAQYPAFDEIPENAWTDTREAADAAAEQYKEKKRKEEEARKAAEEARRAQEEAERIAAEQAAAEQAAAEQAAAEQAAAEQQAAVAQTVSTQAPAMSASTDELSLLAAIIFCEAGNQPYEGQVAVGAVILNRVRSGVYPNSIAEVIYQPGQFGPAMSGWLDSVLASGGYTETARQAAADALAGSNPIGDCLYFGCGDYGIRIGDHFFH